MDYYSKKILKYINKYSSKENPIDIYTIKNKFKYDDSTIINSLNMLVQSHKVECRLKSITDDGIYHSVECYLPTTIGLGYFKSVIKINILEFIKWLIFSVLTPLLVAYLTSKFTCDVCSNETNQDNSYPCNYKSD